MSTDRELLELAAKAAGIKVTWSELAECHFINDGLTPWNPLTDDGDALRLAVKLKLDIEFYNGTQEVVVSDYEVDFLASEPYGEDMNAAIRRAIVRAASAIGESMP